jgi:pimeloyl-ACP methyl ester carboxylesterase
MPYVETPDGLPLHYEERGEGETIVLVHGWTMNAEYWWQKNEASLAESHHVVTVDLRGHGSSGKTDEGHTLRQYARDVRHVVDSLALADVTLVGWSMGAATAMSYVDQFGSDRLRSLALVDQSPYFYSEEGWEYPAFGEFSPEALAGILEALRTDRAGLVKEELLPAFFVETPPAETVDEMYAEMMKTPTSVAVAMLQELCDNDFREVVSSIDVPTLLVYGSKSAVFPGAGEWMHDRVPESELRLFEASSHCPFWEEPRRFNRELTRFVASRDDRAVGRP